MVTADDVTTPETVVHVPSVWEFLDTPAYACKYTLPATPAHCSDQSWFMDMFGPLSRALRSDCDVSVHTV